MRAVQVIVNRDLCESNALCVDAAPEVFLVGEDDVLEVLDVAPDESLRPKVEAAVRACPKMALSLAEG
jgi:ferredoxin